MPTSAPSHTPPQNIGILTRSGRAIGTPSSTGDTESSRASQSPKGRRNLRKKANSKKSGGPNIDQPLSILTKDYKTPVRDMGLWVNRSIEDRMAEVEKKKGYISRPMNSFMLYRSAYAERVKQFCKENNHQVVSQVTGASWPLEPKEVRDLYEQYAIMERDNHAAAHPNYKFAPNKAGKRARNDDDSETDPEWEGSTKGSKRSRSVRRFDSRSASSTPFEERPAVYHHVLPAQHQLAGYEMANPYGPPQRVITSNGLVGDYYQAAPAVRPYEHVSDLAYRGMEEGYSSYQPSLGLVGMPHAEHHELLTTYHTSQPMSVPVQSEMLDPRLGQVDPSYQLVYYDGVGEAGPEVPRTIAYESAGPQLELGYEHEGYHPGLATLTADGDVWADQGNVGLNFEAEFQRMS